MVKFFNPNIRLFFFPPHRISTKILAKSWYTVACFHPIVHKHFLKNFLQVKKQTPYTLLLETGSLPIEIMTMERVVEYILKVQKVPRIDFLELHGKEAKRSKRRIKANICISV